MGFDEKIKRINELYHKSQKGALSEASGVIYRKRQGKLKKPVGQRFHTGGGRQYYKSWGEVRETDVIIRISKYNRKEKQGNPDAKAWKQRQKSEKEYLR